MKRLPHDAQPFIQHFPVHAKIYSGRKEQYQRPLTNRVISPPPKNERRLCPLHPRPLLSDKGVGNFVIRLANCAQKEAPNK